MNQNDFKKFLNEALEPIKQKQDNQSKDLAGIKEKQETQSIAISRIEDKQKTHSGALVSIESKLNAYGDMYKINNSNAKKLEKRVETLEENADITPPYQFTLSEVS
mgnify:CR=1 FL=1